MMLSLAKVTAGAQAASYYEGADDYYTSDRSPSVWLGKGAEALGLRGGVDSTVFCALLDGHLPDGSKIRNAAENGRRGGTDLTFSAPKSVSLQVYVGGDARLIDAHERAVARAIAYVEAELAGFRETTRGETERRLSGNLLIAQFRHDLSRGADPQLHSHCVLVNATQRPDGTWRALDVSELYRQQKVLGALYRNELALEVQSLGYPVRLTHGDGRFELAHIKREQVEAFSSRSQAVEAALAKLGKTREDATAREKEVVTLKTRERKAAVDRAQLRETWRQKSRALRIAYAPALTARAPSPDERLIASRETVSFAVRHAIEREAVVTGPQLLRAALERGTSKTDLSAIRAEIEQRVAGGALLRAGTRYTTPEAQALERSILALEVRGRGQLVPILTEREAIRTLAGTALNAGQRAAASLIVTSDSRIVAIQGAAGTGKTTMLAEALRVTEQEGYQLRGLAPSASSVRALSSAGIKSETVAAFLAREAVSLSARTVLVLDEAGMVPARDMHQLLTRAENSNARVVLVGDLRQLKAVEAGRPFAQLQTQGVPKVEMDQIQRQTDQGLKRAVELAAKGEVGRSLRVLRRNVVEIERKDDRFGRIAADYAALAPEARATTLIVAGTHSAREAINRKVREVLGLAGSGVTVKTLARKDCTEAQAKSSLSYQPGELVEARKHYGSLGLRRGERAMVVESGHGKVLLEKSDGKRVEWRPVLMPHFNSYQVRERELTAGDRIRLTANDYENGIANGDLGTVRSTGARRISIERTDGSILVLDSSKPLHLDHGYCSTVHASQGQTCERVLIEGDTHSLTANESGYYVAISRARTDAVIYTDDKELLPHAMSRPDIKEAALDLSDSTLPAELRL